MQTGKGEVVNSRRIDVGLKVIHADRPRAVLHGNIDFLLLSNHFQRFFYISAFAYMQNKKTGIEYYEL